MAAAVKTSPPAVIMGPPRFSEPVFIPGTILPSGVSQSFFPDSRSTAVVVPQGGGLHGTPLGESRGSRYIAYGAPRCLPYSPCRRSPACSCCVYSSCSLSCGISLTQNARRLVFMMSRWRAGSSAALPQFTPPTLPGKAIVPSRLGGVKIPSDRDAAILLLHHSRSSADFPHASLAVSF